jgi:pyridoxine 4-dehydrogenase
VRPESRISKNASGKRENETAGLSGELLIGDDFLVARLGLGTMRLTGKGIWGEPTDRSEAIRVVKRAVELGSISLTLRIRTAPMSARESLLRLCIPIRKASSSRRRVASSGRALTNGLKTEQAEGKIKHIGLSEVSVRQRGARWSLELDCTIASVVAF